MRPTPAPVPSSIGIGIIAFLLMGTPVGAVAQETEELPVTLKADSYQFDRQARIITARGHVVLSVRDVTVRADTLVADLQTGLVTAEGSVQLEVAGQSVAAEMLTFNLSTRVGTLFNARTEYHSPLILGSVRLRAEKLEGDLARFVTIRNGFTTTCEEPEPVAYATADELQVYPNDKIVGHHVSLWIAGHRLFTVPYFIISLRERRGGNFSPVIGYGDTEGWFVKTSWSYFVNENHYGFVHADWYERLGVGAGIEHLYRSAGGEGSVLVYGLANRQTGGTDLHDFLNHLQRLGDVTLRTFVDYQDLSSSTGSPTTNLFATLDLSTQTQQSSTYLFSTLFESSASPVSTLNSQFAHLQNFGPRLGAEVFLNYDQIGDPTGVDQELLPRITLRYFGDGVAATLVTDTRWDLDGTHSTADDKYILERLPELNVTVSPFRIGETPLYAQAVVGLAQFRETTPGPTGGVLDAGRVDAQVTVSGFTALAGGSVGMRTFARQSWYTTGDARVFYGGRLEYARSIGAGVDTGFGYTAQTTIGVSPFIFDQIAGTLSLADAQITYHTQDLLLRATGFYDFQSGLFGDVIGQVIYLPRPDLSVGLAGSYNPNVGQLDRVEAALDLQVSKEWRFEYSGAWDSFTQSVITNRLSLTRTFCECLAMSVTYLGARQEIWLEAWLTAVPWGRGKIGLGAQGTLLFEQPWWLLPQR